MSYTTRFISGLFGIALGYVYGFLIMLIADTVYQINVYGHILATYDARIITDGTVAISLITGLAFAVKNILYV